ncbi:MAG: ribosome silencing factor [Hydrogenophaga sp.]|nr:ribosome silencing factor [Hydrogenophaga sp.]
MTSESTSKKQLQRLQRAIVDGLEDVKGQDIVVFNTEELSPLFERVIVASGTSNRQTRALAASVRDAVREAGFDKPRIEGEDNGEWIIVDCGQVVAHVMQPVIRQYYRLEEIWGVKPVRLRHGAAKDKPATVVPAPATRKGSAKLSASGSAKPAVTPAKAAKAAKAPAQGKSAGPSKAAPSSSRAAPGKKPAPAKSGAKSAAVAKAAPGPKSRSQTPMAKLVVNKPRAAAKPTASRPAARKPVAKKSPS